ncbi:MAG: response regulator [Verrucomicrobiota bacterium]
MNDPNKSPILVIDDDPYVLSMYRVVLESCFKDKTFVFADSGTEALNLLKRKTPLLIITDRKLPDIDGTEIVTHSLNKNPRIPIIIVSGFTIIEDLQALLDKHSNIMFLAKPFERDTLINTINQLLERSPDSFITGIHLLSLIQIVGLEERTCEFDLQFNNKQGTIFFENGDMKFIRAGTLEGKEALEEMIHWATPHISVFNDHTTAEKNVDQTAQELIIDVCQDMKLDPLSQ